MMPMFLTRSAAHALTCSLLSLWLVSCDEPLALTSTAQAASLSAKKPAKKAGSFHLSEAKIDDIQQAIQAGEITCHDVVKGYLDRAAAYNGVCTQLVTADGAAVPAATGAVRAGAAIQYPTTSVPIAAMLPDLDKYTGPPIELGRMEPTVSDPSVQLQYGIITGIRHAGQVNALETINLRGERSVTCKGDFDLAPANGPLPAGAPAACEAFRQMPDALERAAELDAQYGSEPDLTQMPMYCVVFSVKNWYDAKDMRSTGGNDVKFAMDAPPEDSHLVTELRAKGAIIFAKSVASQVTNTSTTGPETPTKDFVPSTDNARDTWGGTACTPYDTERSPGFSSGGAGASVASNLVTCGICETTGGSCRIPANSNNVASLVTTKGVVSSDRGWTAQYTNHRPGVLCRNLGDAARVLDAIKDPDTGYFDTRDIFTAIPPALIPPAPYESYVMQGGTLSGVKVGIVREFMIAPNPNNIAINKHNDEEIKSVLRDKLGAKLVESLDPLYGDDPEVDNMTYTFQDALSEVMPLTLPQLFNQTTAAGDLEFAVPNYDVTTRDYLVQLSLRRAPLSDNLNLRRLTSVSLDNALRTPFLMDKYLAQRGDESIADWTSFAANAAWFAEPIRTGSDNVALVDQQDIRSTAGIDRLAMVSASRLALDKVMRENQIDVLVMTNIPAPVERNEFARDPTTKDVRSNGPSITDLMNVPEVIVPSGYNQIVYEAQYALSADTTSYITVAGSVQSTLADPLPTSLMFWGGPGDEPKILRVASAYEAATHHRVPPADFPPLRDEP
jgi:amidase